MRAVSLLLCAALAAAAFATALSPGGYRHGVRLALALLAGFLLWALLALALQRLLRRRATRAIGFLSVPAVVALSLLLVVAAARMVAFRSAAAESRNDQTQAQQAFHRWTLQAVPPLVRYQDTLAADAAIMHALTGGPVDASLIARVDSAQRRLLALEQPIHLLVTSAPGELRPFMPLLGRALKLAVSAQRDYAAALSKPASSSRSWRLGRGGQALVRRGDRTLERSQQAMAAFSFDVNGVGARLYSG